MKILEVGDTLHGWKILSIDGVARDGHKILTVQCLACGYVRHNACSRDVVQNPNCNHVEKKVRKWPSKRLKKIYCHMKYRCYCPSSRGYRFYGGRGIKVCDEWKNDPNTFIRWALNNGYEENLSIDRIDSDLDYSPNNCRWISPNDNAKWKSTTNTYTVSGISDSGRGWSKRLGLGINFMNRYAKNHTMEETLSFIQNKLEEKNIK